MKLMAALAAFAASAAAGTVSLETLDLKLMSSGWGSALANRAVTTNPLSIGGTVYDRGIGTHAPSRWVLALDGRATEFRAEVGVDDQVKAGQPGSVEFVVIAGEDEIWRSGALKPGQPAKPVRVPLSGVRQLILDVEDAGNGRSHDHADWAAAEIDFSGEPPRAVAAPVVPEEEAVILTPPAPRAPRIHGPKIYGARPGKPFLYRIPATGERPMVFAAEGLPAGLELDPQGGIVRGATPPRGDHKVTFTARNAHGTDARSFTIVAGDTLALTPPMGWNHWYTHYNRITDATMREAADVMITSGMADHGYQYVNIDDCWMNAAATGKYQPDPKRVGPERKADGSIQPNAYFPDMKGLADYIHAKGLKAGLYTSPGPKTCAGFGGALGHEAQDAKTFADWGYDFLKYDWCSYGRIAADGSPADPAIPAWGKGPPTLAGYQYPFRKMGELLKRQGRDIVFNLCQYGMGDVWTWGAEVGGHSWRTTGDLGLEKASRLPGFYAIGMRTAKLHEFARPGAWNDPDYILIGWYGNARGLREPEKAPLTPNETYSYMSMWSLMAAPLFFSGDMSKLDAFTINVLCNPEVIGVNQDALGRQARIVRQSETEFVLAKPLEDGSLAVGLFALGRGRQTIAVSWKDLGVEGPRRVRDVWRCTDAGTADGEWKADVPRHGVSLVRLVPVTRL
jgi:alpha-galactosidase